MNDYLAQLIAMITGSGNAMAQPGNVDQAYANVDNPDGGMMDIVNAMRAPQGTAISELEYLNNPNPSSFPSGDDDGMSNTLEQLIEQKMRNSGNTPVTPINNINAMRAFNPQRASRSLDADPISALLEAKEIAMPAAEMYMKDGTVPPLERGPQGDMIRKFMYENIMKKQKDYQ